MTRHFRYLGEALITGFSRRDGSEVLLHYGEVYELDDEEPFIRTLLGKRDERGMPKSWLVEVETSVSSTEEADDQEEQKYTDTSTKKRSK